MKKGFFTSIFCILLGLTIGFVLGQSGMIDLSGQKPDIEYISGKIVEASELTTAKLKYTGIISYERGKVPFLTKKAFSMKYDASLDAIVDLSKVVPEIREHEVYIRIPSATISKPEIDESTIEFYDERHALLRRDEKEDLIAAIEAAKSDVTYNIDLDALIEEANVNAKTILEGFLSECIGDYTLVIEVDG